MSKWLVRALFSAALGAAVAAPAVADECGLTVVAVYVLKSRMLARLREEILALSDDAAFLDPP